MNIEASSINLVNDKKQTSKQQSVNNTDTKFSDELKGVKEGAKEEIKEESNEEVNKGAASEKPDVSPADEKVEKCTEAKETKETSDVKETKEPKPSKEVKNPDEEANKKDSINNKVNLEDALIDLTNMVNKLNQSEDKELNTLKDFKIKTDTNNEGEDLINNDFNIDNKDKLPQMTPNMNFGGDGQPFSSFMNNSEQNSTGSNQLASSAKDLAEEAAILSTMAENIAMANKVNVAQQAQAEESQQPKDKIIHQNDGIRKVDTKTNIVKETIVKYDTVIVNEADAEVFANLVQNGEVNLNNLAPEAARKSVEVSKTLADMLAKAMEDNKPVRIEFDNGISVIIKVSREGKIRADFLPSTQVAEAYLKENLPLLKQRFDEQNIEYDELNQRERREKEQDKKKGREQHE